MQGIYKAIAKAGIDQKTFAAETGIDRYMLNKAAKGKINLTPADFKKVCARSGLRPDQIATVQDVDYGVIPIKSIAEIKRPEKRKRKASLRFRIIPNQRKQIDKDLQILGFATIQSWGDFCIKHLHFEAEQKRGHIHEP